MKYKCLTNTAIHNLSNQDLTPNELLVLGLGSKYVPLPSTHKLDLTIHTHNAIDAFHRRLRLAFHFSEPSLFNSSIPKNTTKVPWTPDPMPIDKFLTTYIWFAKEKASHSIDVSKSVYSTSDSILHKTLESLSSNKNIVIKPADKNLGLVVLNTNDYYIMCMKHLNDIHSYEIVQHYMPNAVFAKLRVILTKFNKLKKNKDEYTPLAASLLQLQDHSTLRIAPFYCIPKIHKTLIDPPGRPIISSVSTATYHASVYLDKELQPFMKKLKTVCTSSQHLIMSMYNRSSPKGSVLLCADITSLYPNIPIGLGIGTVRKVLKSLNAFTPTHLDFLMNLLHWILTENYCTFDNVIYHQLKGTAMGTPVAVSYANIFLYGIENPLLDTFTPSFFIRYIDDVFAVFESKVAALQFVQKFNEFCPSIKFEAVTTERTGIMLDLELSLNYDANSDSDIITHKIYQKPMNIYQYIPTQSEHSTSIYHNFVLQELKRYNLACTNTSDYNAICKSFAVRLLARGYDQKIFTTALSKVPTRSTQLKELFDRLQLPTQTEYTPGRPIIILKVPRTRNRINWKYNFLIENRQIWSHPTFIKNFRSKDVLICTSNSRNISSFINKATFVRDTTDVNS